jgi:hypothetical protein
MQFLALFFEFYFFIFFFEEIFYKSNALLAGKSKSKESPF